MVSLNYMTSAVALAAAILVGIAAGVAVACWQYLGQLPDPTDY